MALFPITNGSLRDLIRLLLPLARSGAILIPLALLKDRGHLVPRIVGLQVVQGVPPRQELLHAGHSSRALVHRRLHRDLLKLLHRFQKGLVLHSRHLALAHLGLVQIVLAVLGNLAHSHSAVWVVSHQSDKVFLCERVGIHVGPCPDRGHSLAFPQQTNLPKVTLPSQQGDDGSVALDLHRALVEKVHFLCYLTLPDDEFLLDEGLRL